jgi:hypothetical protein
LALALAGVPSGRFAGDWPAVSGFEFSQSGFRARLPSAVWWRYHRALRGTRPVAGGREEAVYWLIGSAPAPVKMRANVYSPGFDLYWERGIVLDVVAQQEPRLTWSEGSVGPGVPSAPARWVAVSFGADQPPILLAGSLPSLTVTGAPGFWSLRSPEFVGWVRVALPLGLGQGVAGDAAALGGLAQRIGRHEAFWLAPTRRVIERKATQTADTIEIRLTFDGPGAVAPFALTLAKLAGWPVSSTTPIIDLAAPLDEGPMSYVQGTSLAYRLPITPVAPGRPMHGDSVPGPERLSPDDLGALASEGWRSFLAGSPSPVAAGLLADFESRPSADASSAALAVHWWLARGIGATDADARLLEALEARFDPLGWRVTGSDGREAAALLASGLWWSPEPQARAWAAELAAGLEAERGAALFRRRRGGPPEPPPSEPWAQMRRALFLGEERPSLISHPWRVVADWPIAYSVEPDGLVLSWDAATGGQMAIVGASPPLVRRFDGAEDWAMAALAPGVHAIAFLPGIGPKRLVIDVPVSAIGTFTPEWFRDRPGLR